MKDFQIQFAVNALAVLGIGWTVYLVIIKRERSTFLNLSLHALPISTLGNFTLVQISIRLENKGKIRIDARRLAIDGDYLYNDKSDACRHAGTLKIRRVPDTDQETIFDWYCLPITKMSGDKTADLEQINYLSEFLDPKAEFKEVDFWLEPCETYELNVLICLLPGTYAAKAYFIGRKRKHKEEEYWSTTSLFHIERQI